MGGLNSSVITGKCSGCTAYRGKLEEARKKLAAVHDFVEEQYKDGVCLWCGWESGGSLDFHCCWVGALDRILKGGD